MNKNEKFVITINREVGSGGRTIGEIVAAKLGVTFYDKGVIDALCKKYNLSVKEIESLKGRKHDWWSDFLRVLGYVEENTSSVINEPDLLNASEVKALYTDCNEITVTVSDAATKSDNCDWTWTRTYTIKDAYDNTATNSMSVLGSDQTAPALKATAEWPTDITGQDNCFANADTTGLKDASEIKALYEDCSNITVTVSDNATATDNCGSNLLSGFESLFFIQVDVQIHTVCRLVERTVER